MPSLRKGPRGGWPFGASAAQTDGPPTPRQPTTHLQVQTTSPSYPRGPQAIPSACPQLWPPWSRQRDLLCNANRWCRGPLRFSSARCTAAAELQKYTRTLWRWGCFWTMRAVFSGMRLSWWRWGWGGRRSILWAGAAQAERAPNKTDPFSNNIIGIIHKTLAVFMQQNLGWPEMEVALGDCVWFSKAFSRVIRWAR